MLYEVITNIVYSPYDIYVSDAEGKFSVDSRRLANTTADLENLSCNPDGMDRIRTSLQENGVYLAAPDIRSEAPNIAPDGSCSMDNPMRSSRESYALGHYLNYLETIPPLPPRA